MFVRLNAFYMDGEEVDAEVDVAIAHITWMGDIQSETFSGTAVSINGEPDAMSVRETRDEIQNKIIDALVDYQIRIVAASKARNQEIEDIMRG